MLTIQLTRQINLSVHNDYSVLDSDIKFYKFNTYFV